MSHITLNKLILVGNRKNYVTTFNKGVNIIYGDSDTGKSSILEFIDYMLGSKKIELADEVSASVNYSALELYINKSIFTIKRNIYNPSDFIEVYSCSFEGCDKVFPRRFNPSFNVEGAPDGFLSDFLMNELGFPLIKIKSSPSKSDSELQRLSFRDLFKFCYLNQNDVGDLGFLDQSNWFVSTKNKEVFKYIFNLLDSSISEKQSEISFKSKERNSLKQKYKLVSEFLRETETQSIDNLDRSIDEIDIDLNSLKEKLIQVNKEMISDSKEYNQIKSFFDELVLYQKATKKKIDISKNLIDKYSRLKNDYDNDIKKIEAQLVAKQRLGLDTLNSSPCPICDNEIEISEDGNPFQQSPIELLKDELNSLTKRRKNISSLIDEQIEKYKKLQSELNSFEIDIQKARVLLDTESENMVTPYLTQRDTVVKEIASLEQQRKSYVENLKIRNQHNSILQRCTSLDGVLEGLEEELKKLLKDAPVLDAVINDLTDLLDDYMEVINIKNRRDIRISEKTFLPIVRGRDYTSLTSGGLRTITSIGHVLGILNYAVSESANHPKLLMIDTVGKYLGKTKLSEKYTNTVIDEDLKEGLADPLKYKNLFDAIIKVCNNSLNDNNACQVILVDNDVPTDLVDQYNNHIVAHFSSTGDNELPIGLIDDYIHTA